MSFTGFNARVVADSVSPAGARLTTLELTFPRMILSEFNTHRVFSRNSASSRAIPVSKQIRKIIEHPFVPEKFGTNIPGMQAGEPLSGANHDAAVREWLHGRSRMVQTALGLILGSDKVDKLSGVRSDIRLPFDVDNPETRASIEDALLEYEAALRHKNRGDTEGFDYLNVHKEIANRVLEPVSWHTVIVTATEWSNFFALRTHSDAQPQIQHISLLAQGVYNSSVPRLVREGEYHLPLVQEDELAQAREEPLFWCKVSSGRCARTSHETHNGVRDTSSDIGLFERLKGGGHMSPLEHVATPLSGKDATKFSGNFKGWHQWRKDFVHEDDFSLIVN